MRHVKALAIKLIAIFIILWVFLRNVDGLSTQDILTITVAFSLVEYVIGDLILLRYTNNTISTIGDFGLAMIIIYVMTRDMTTADDLFTATLYASIGVTIFEYFFHKYVQRHIHDETQNNHRISPSDLHYQTEASEELTDVERNKD